MLALMSGKTPVISNAVILQGPKTLGLGQLDLTDPGPDDLVVDVRHSGISTGTEKLFWSGEMPPFPGMGYPLVPGYEAAGEVVAVGPGTGFKVGDVVFVPGANCYGEVKGLFGGAASRLVTAANRVVRIDPALGPEGALLALAATARHALAGMNTRLPELIIGHGVFGRLLARLTIAAGGQPRPFGKSTPTASKAVLATMSFIPMPIRAATTAAFMMLRVCPPCSTRWSAGLPRAARSFWRAFTPSRCNSPFRPHSFGRPVFASLRNGPAKILPQRVT